MKCYQNEVQLEDASVLVDLVELEWHTDARCYDTTQEFHVTEDPFVTNRSDAQVTFEESMQTTQKELHTETQQQINRDEFTHSNNNDLLTIAYKSQLSAYARIAITDICKHREHLFLKTDFFFHHRSSQPSSNRNIFTRLLRCMLSSLCLSVCRCRNALTTSVY